MAGATASNAISQSEASRAQGDYQRSQSYLNASLADRQGQDAIERGAADANTARRKGNATVASQKSQMAAQGLDVGAGGGSDEVLEATRTLSEAEQLNIKTNAWREAWGYKIAAINDRAEGDMAQIAGKGAAKQTLIAGGMQAVGYGASGYRAGPRNSGGSESTRSHSFAGNPQRAYNRVD